LDFKEIEVKLNKINFEEYIALEIRRGDEDNGEKPLQYYLFQKKNDGSFWEARPLYDEEDMYYSGGPMEYVEVSPEYVKEHYQKG
jgi:hypothetical protein